MLLIRVWILDEDTGRKKLVSPWFNYDDPEKRKELDVWLNVFPGRRFLEEFIYVKEQK